MLPNPNASDTVGESNLDDDLNGLGSVKPVHRTIAEQRVFDSKRTNMGNVSVYTAVQARFVYTAVGDRFVYTAVEDRFVCNVLGWLYRRLGICIPIVGVFKNR